ncbi:unnamed protein product [Adineta steineri]|uniref:Uncharacterized protein n=1 Tax=Adineta steineri TaxID=433720 RepID=A0A814SNH3_9BILA|nr:unnamed protein product [Adineta steineri]CAF3975486.1 unnamed protein product [Adineta steineri]
MISTNQMGLATGRVRCSTEIDLQDLHCSTICKDILWKPLACQQCETHFCLKCIAEWLKNNPNQCPLRCDSFIQRPCSKFIARQLAKLQLVCINWPNGCNEVIPYEALEKHEMVCEYQHVKCTGCQLEMLQKNVTEHQSQCSAIVARCDDCKMVYKHVDTLTQHSDLICLRKQFRDFRQESQHEIQQLKEQLQEAQNNQITILVSRGITVEDAAAKRTFIQWTDQVGILDTNRIVLDESSQPILNDRLLCSKCHNIFWKPVSCRICGVIFCKRCCPRPNFYTMLFSKRSHEKNDCKNFKEVPAPHDITVDLGRLRVRCAYAPNGCQMISPYNDLEEHESQCEFEIVPCQVCQLPLSKRPPIVEHTLRVCFEEMMRKNPAPMQQQFMQLVNVTEKAEAENRRLQSVIDNLKIQLNTLDSTCIKKKY